MIAALLWWNVIGVTAGWLANRIRPRTGFGPAADIILGIIGAWAGGCFVRFVVHPYNCVATPGMYVLVDASLQPSILFAALGALALVWFVRPWLKWKPKEIRARE
ncbi:MAG TPA: GlsB/YeaQ/YmgE family stress response membrane protein [Candidatus Angelobacter sp.]|nr:GlsB/YeaQ/YmgE family stress response membrane protein [Candidatus Angelobacter sp.]